MKTENGDGLSVRSQWLAALVGLAIFLMGHHPPFPGPLEYVPLDESTDDTGWELVATPGFVSSEQPDQLVCKEAFGVEGNLYGAVLGPSHYAMAAADGLAVTFDGCHLDELHDVEGEIIDIAARPGGRLAVATVASDDDRLYVSTDGGHTLQESIPAGEQLRLTGVDWIDDDRVAVSGYDDSFDDRGAGQFLVASIEENDWIRRDAFDTDLRYPFLFAADTDGVAVAGRSSAEHSELVLAWGPPQQPDAHTDELPRWPKFADTEDGRVWVAPLEDAWDRDWTGIAVGDDGGQLQPDPRFDDHDTRCVVRDGEGLWVCSSGYAEAYEIWRADDGYDPDPFYRLATLEGPRTECPDDSAVARLCPDAWELIVDDIPRRPLDSDDEAPPPDQDAHFEPDDDPPDPHDATDDEGDSAEDSSNAKAACHQARNRNIWLFALILAVVFLQTRFDFRGQTAR